MALMSRQEIESERAHLERILAVAREQLRAAELSCAERHEALTFARRELREQTEQMFTNLWSAQDFEALADLNRLAQPLAVDQKAHEMSLVRIQTLKRMLDAPYFARIDMRFDDGGDIERVYIGRATLRHDRTHEILVHDWRAPIASVFYRFGLGPVHYDAPAGRITGEVLLKRQYEIRRGALEFFFDADVQIQDEYLRKLLSGNASPRMRAIVETIQRDQDAAIRDVQNELLMVQGVAGSGKTSIALHRVAYLMYEGLAARLSASNILILSPNELFTRYIENVLPELGEQSVASVSFERMLEKVLGSARVVSRSERFEALCDAGADERPLMMDALAFKSSRAFINILDRFVDELPRRWIEFQDVCYGGRTVASRQRLKASILAGDKKLPLGVRLERMERSLMNGVGERRPERMNVLRSYARRSPAHVYEIEAFARARSIQECAALRRHVRRFTKLDSRALYRALVSDERSFRRLAGENPLPDRISHILRATHAALDKDALPFEDATAVAYLTLRLMGAGHPFGDIRQLVVDEAQDYGPMQYAVLNLLFSRSRFTVVGDVNQAIDRRADMSLYEQIGAVLNRRSAALVELTKSFRCTSEILRFSLKFLGPNVRVEGVGRAGDEPRVYGAGDARELDQMIADEVALCRGRGYKSIALITKTARGAKRWHERLKPVIPVGLAFDGTETGDVFVIPLALSKGLEFDAVLVPDAGRAHYGAPEDAGLLYVACTRALHRLNLFYEGEPSPHLIEEEARA